MKNRILAKCVVFLLVIVMCLQMTVNASAVSVNPGDTATEENVLEVLRQYDPDAYHIMNTEANSFPSFMFWFMGRSLISGIDTAVHETYHRYTFNQNNGFYGERIFLGDGKSYDVDYSVVYNGGTFTKTEEMSKQIPAQLQTSRYDTYVASGASADANTKGVFGLLNEFTAYYWGLETMNSLAQFLLDTNADADAWRSYVISIGNNMTAYAEFKYWTLRYMLYIKSANPSLYQAILDNENYCAAYRDADAKFVSEISRSREIISDFVEYLRSKGLSVDWSDSGIYLRSGYSSSGMALGNYSTLMAELNTAEYVEMDSILKNMGYAPVNPPVYATLSPQKLTVDGKNVDCEKYNIGGNNYFKLRDLAYILNGTGSQFSVDFNATTSTVSITTGTAYSSIGTELMAGVDNSSTAQPSSQTILINGVEYGDLAVYNIGGSNFFQLRELGDILGFEVDFDAATNTAIVRSKESEVSRDTFVSNNLEGEGNVKLSRVNYYDASGTLIYYECYAYYNNGRLCSITLHSIDSYSIGGEYTLLYLYDGSGNLTETVLGALTIPDWFNRNTGEVTLGYKYDSNGNSRKVSIYPTRESIEQEKFGVDPTKTERIYSDAPIIYTDTENGWASAYLRDVFDDSISTDITECRLIYVDNNLTPELWIDYGYSGQAYVYTVENGVTDSVYIYSGTAHWIEYNNILYTSGGRMDYYSDMIYQIQNGKFKPIAEGNFGAIDNSHVQVDKNNNPIYDYYWNGVKVAQSDYERYISNAFDKSIATDNHQNIYTYEQCKLLLQSIQK